MDTETLEEAGAAAAMLVKPGTVQITGALLRETQPTQGVATCTPTVSLLVVICRPAAAFCAAFARTVSPLQVIVTKPAGMLCPAELNVTLRASLTVLSNEEAIEDGTEKPQPAVNPLVIRLLPTDGKVNEMKSVVALKVVAVVKEMVAVPAVVGLAENPDSVGRVTQPTQGVATCTPTVSLLVVICRLPVALAMTVSELQETVTGPAGMLCPAFKVSVRASVLFVNVVAADVDGTDTTHAVLAAVAVIRLAGKARTMVSV